MQVARWGNSLAVRLPASLVRELGLAEGDEVELRAVDARTLEVAREAAREKEREEAMATLRALRKPLPPDYKWNREELYERGRE